MTCESVDDDCAGNWWQETDVFEEAQLPRIVSLTSLSFNGGNIENDSITGVLPAVAQWPLSSVLSKTEAPSKQTNVECSVVLEKLPERLVQATKNRRIIVPRNVKTNASRLKSRRIGRAVPAAPFEPPEFAVKTEPLELNNVENNEQVLVPRQSTPQNLPIVKARAGYLLTNGKVLGEHSYIKRTANKLSVATMTDSACPSVATGTSVRNDAGAESDISVILLNAAQQPKAAVLDATNPAAAKQPQDMLGVVQHMLEQQNISPLSDSGSTTSVMCDENKQQDKRCLCSDDLARLRKLLHTRERRNTVLSKKLEAEQGKVRYLLAEVASLKNTVKQLTLNSSCGVECAPVDTRHSSME